MTELTEKERAFLRKLLTPHLEYYALLSGHAKCSEAKRERLAELRALAEKLEEKN